MYVSGLFTTRSYLCQWHLTLVKCLTRHTLAPRQGTNMAANFRLNTLLPQTLPPSSSGNRTWLTRTPSSSGTSYVVFRLMKTLQHSVEKTYASKWPPTIVPASATSYTSRTENQEHVHTCTSSSHTCCINRLPQALPQVT